MEPHTLIGPPSPLGSPAPYAILVALKVLGFTLHASMMNVWFAGVLTAMVLRWLGGEHARTLSSRLMNAMPIILALGINFGIVPLLFTQVTAYQAFYPATILMAWPWLAVIPLVTLGYYGVYAYAVGVRTGRMPAWRVAVGWGASAALILASFVFVNAFSLMTRLDLWTGLWESTSVAGAPLGIALNVGDPTLWPRWLMFFALAFTTAAAYGVVDAGWFAGKESDEYRAWARRFLPGLYFLGALGFAAFGAWYVFGTWPVQLRETMLSGPLVVLTAVTAVAPALGLAAMGLVAWRGVSRGLALGVGLVQFAVLAVNAVARQVVQNLELGRFLDVTAERLDPQWVPLGLFLVLFVAGLVFIGWLLRRAVVESRELEAAGA